MRLTPLLGTFLALAGVLLFLGLWRSAWWPLAGGVGALAAAAWLVTDDAEASDP